MKKVTMNLKELEVFLLGMRVASLYSHIIMKTMTLLPNGDRDNTKVYVPHNMEMIAEMVRHYASSRNPMQARITLDGYPVALIEVRR